MAAAPDFSGYLVYMTRFLYNMEDFSTARLLSSNGLRGTRLTLPRSIFSKTLAKELKAKTI